MLSTNAISIICSSCVAIVSIASPIVTAIITNRSHRANEHFDKFLSEKSRCLNALAASFAMFRIRTARTDVHIGADGLKEISRSAYELASYCGEVSRQKLWHFVDELSAHFFAGDESTEQCVFDAYAAAIAAVCDEISNSVRRKPSCK